MTMEQLYIYVNALAQKTLIKKQHQYITGAVFCKLISSLIRAMGNRLTICYLNIMYFANLPFLIFFKILHITVFFLHDPVHNCEILLCYGNIFHIHVITGTIVIQQSTVQRNRLFFHNATPSPWNLRLLLHTFSEKDQMML